MLERTKSVLEKAKWLVDLFQKKGVLAWSNQYSPCVVLPAPSPDLAKEYHLPLYSSKTGQYTHIFTMEHVSKASIELFVQKYLLDIKKT